MKTATFALLVCVCASVQAQEVRLEYADPLGAGRALLGTEQIAIDLVIDFSPTAPPVAGGSVNIGYDASLVGLSRIDSTLPPCPAATPCVIPGTDNGAGFIEMQGFEAVAGFSGTETIATLVFDALQIGIAAFAIGENPANPFVGLGGLPYLPPIDFLATSVEIVNGQTCITPSLPETFENASGVPPEWQTFFNPPIPRGPTLQWRSSAEPGACDFGNVTNGSGNAACLEQDQPTEGFASSGSFLCTNAPLDLSTATLPVLELDVNFQPLFPGSAIFSVIGGTEPPPAVGGYTTFFETDVPLGNFAELPGESIIVGPLPDLAPFFVCIVVDGAFFYAEVDECLACALSCSITDDDGDGVPNGSDNCLTKPNPDQRDTDSDGIGNACDADIASPNDCAVNFLDLGVVKAAFFSTQGQATYNPDADFDGDGSVNFADLMVTKEQFFGPPGPSGAPNACDGPARMPPRPDCGIPD